MHFQNYTQWLLYSIAVTNCLENWQSTQCQPFFKHNFNLSIDNANCNLPGQLFRNLSTKVVLNQTNVYAQNQYVHDSFVHLVNYSAQIILKDCDDMQNSSFGLQHNCSESYLSIKELYACEEVQDNSAENSTLAPTNGNPQTNPKKNNGVIILIISFTSFIWFPVGAFIAVLALMLTGMAIGWLVMALAASVLYVGKELGMTINYTGKNIALCGVKLRSYLQQAHNNSNGTPTPSLYIQVRATTWQVQTLHTIPSQAVLFSNSAKNSNVTEFSSSSIQVKFDELLKQAPEFREHDLSSECICPISNGLMTDPVKIDDPSVAGREYNFDRKSILTWFATCEEKRTVVYTNPLTGLALISRYITPNQQLKNAIINKLSQLILEQKLLTDNPNTSPMYQLSQI